MPLVQLLEAFETGKRPKGGAVDSGVPSLGGEHVMADGTLKLNPMKYVPADFYQRMNKGQLRIGDVLVVKDGATTGRIGMVEPSFPFDRAGANEHLFLLRVDPRRLDSKYLYFYLRSIQGQAEIMSDFRGAAQGGISREIGEKVRVPLPSLEEQHRIVDLLARAEGIIRLRREAQKKATEIIPALFLDMFGDPATNPKGWPRRTVRQLVARFEGGKNLQAASEGSTKFRILKVSAVTRGEYIETESKPTPTAYDPPRNHIVRVGDMLFSRANTEELVGATAVVRTTNGCTLLPDKLWRFVWNQPVEQAFMHNLFQSGHVRQELGRLSSGTSASMRNISQSKLFELRLPVPPLQKQSVFARHAEALQSIHSLQALALRRATATFEGLLARAFKEADVQEHPAEERMAVA
jgi:type I restriction enzyme S subunit